MKTTIAHTKRYLQLFLSLLIPVFFFSGCSYLSADKDAYKKSISSRPLEAPPELVLPTADKNYQIPKQDVSASQQQSMQDSVEKDTKNEQESSKETNSNATKTESGYFTANNKQWIHVNSSLNSIWDPLVSFWQERKHKFEKKDKALGVIQTGWSNIDTKEQAEGVTSLFQSFGGLFAGSTRERYTVTISESGGGTDIYLRQENQVKKEEDSSSYYTGDDWKDKPEDREKVSGLLKSLYKDLTN